MTAQECIASAQVYIFEQWLLRTKTEILKSAEFSEPLLKKIAPKFLKHLITILQQNDLSADKLACKLYVPELHDLLCSKVSGGTLDQIGREFALLQNCIFDLLSENNVLLSLYDARIISICFQNATSSAGSLIAETIDFVRSNSQNQFHLLTQEATEYAIFTIDPNGIVLDWNAGAQRMKQFTSQEIIGHNYRILYREEDRRAGLPERNLKLALESGRHEEQWWRAKKDGTLFWADAVVTPLYSPSHVLIGFSKIVRDLSKKKRTEDELRDAKEFAEAASGLKSIFVANMSHEIRTPLGAILGFAEVLKDPDCSPKDRLIAAEVIDRNGKILLRLIEDILDLSKIDAGKFDIEISKISIRSLVSEVVALFAARAQEKGLLLKLKTITDIPENIWSDPNRLKQILSNIIGNAVKFTEKGEVSIEIHRTELAGGKSGLEFVVTDTGAGLTGEERKGLFIPFSQADSSATRKSGGSGLGLALSRRLAEKLGGELGLLNFEQGIGCSFRITIEDKNAANEKKNEGAMPVAPPDRLSDDSPLKSVAGSKVLIVDDARDNQLLIKTILDKWGVKSDRAENGAIGVDMALQGNYDLVLMDIQMPVMDGNEAIRTLRRSGYTRPIVVITAHAMTDEKAKAFDSGCDDYLIKPIDRTHLHKILENYAPR